MTPDYVELFERNYRRLVQACTAALGGDAALAEDAVVEGFIRAHRSWARGTIRNPDAYLLVVCLNECRRLRRRRWPMRTEATAQVVLADKSADVDAVRRAEVLDAMAVLTAQECSVVALRYLYDMREVDVAEVLGLPLGSVKSLTHRARAKLKSHAETQLEEKR